MKPSDLPYDLSLRDAAEDFKSICREYDCMGIVLFVSPRHAEFVNHISPSWSLMRHDGNESIRFRSKREDFGSKEEQDLATLATTHGVCSIVEWSRITFEAWQGVLTQLREHMTILHRTWEKPDSVPGDGK